MEEGKRKKSRTAPSKRKKPWKRRYPPHFEGSKKNSTHSKDVVFINYSEIDDYFNQRLDFSLTDTDENCLLVGKEAWDQALIHFHNPAIPDPTFAFDKSKLIGFFIELDTWKTMMNLSNAPMNLLDTQLFNFYNTLALHEISHYVVCPYDIITNARLLKASMRHIPERLSPIVVNFFADLIVDLKLFRVKPKEMEFELRETYKMSNSVGKSKEESEHSNFYKILVKCYEILWDIDLKLPQEKYKAITSASEKIAEIILKNFEDESLWRKKPPKSQKS